MELLLEEQEVPLDLIHKTLREATIAQQICPVLVGSAYKNKGVQPLLDAVNALPAQPARPRDHRQGQRQRDGRDHAGGRPRRARWWPWPSSSSRSRSARSPTCGSTRGRSRRASSTTTRRTARRQRISRILRMHADQKEDIDAAIAGDIVAVMGIECATGDTLLRRGDERLAGEHLRRRAGHRPVDHARQARRLRQALQGPEPLHARGPDLPRPRRPGDQRDDHLRHGRAAPGDLRRADPPRVQGRVHRRHARRCSYRETPTKETPFNYKHKKQTGGSGQYAHVVGVMDPAARPMRPSRSSSRTRSPAAASPASTSPRSRRASGLAAQGARGRLRSHRRQDGPRRTAPTTTSTRRTWPSRSAPATASARPSARPTRSCSSRS